MSNATLSEGERPRVVYAQGWGPGTDVGSLLGGDDFGELFDLLEPMDDDSDDTLLDFLRKAVPDGYVHVQVTVTAHHVALSVEKP